MRKNWIYVMNMLALCGWLNNAVAESVQSGLYVAAIQPDMATTKGIYIGFNALLGGCTSTAKGMHAYLNGSISSYADYLAVINMSLATARPVKIYYSSMGDCSTRSSVAIINKIEYN